MSLAFSHYSVIIKRKSLVEKVINNHIADKHVLGIANYLIGSNLSDEHLVGIESLTENLEDEFSILMKLGLKWNNGVNCIDFFIPSKGTSTATWLNFERVKLNNIYYSVYSHVDERGANIISFDQEFDVCMSDKSVVLDRRNWATVARDELNRLYNPSLVELKNEILCNGRVCPNPILWNELHEIAIEADINNSTPPPLPLILGGWWESENSDKSERLIELINWAFEKNVSDIVWAYLKSLNEKEWHHNYD